VADFCNILLEKDPDLRWKNCQDLHMHPWFADFDWDAFRERRMQPEYIPQKGGTNFDEQYINEPWKDKDSENMLKAELYITEN